MMYKVRSVPSANPTQVSERWVDATSDVALRSSMAQQGQIVLSIQPARFWAVSLPRGQRFDVAWWCRELRTLLKAGMTVVEAIETLHAQSTGGQRAEVHEQLLRALRQGQALSAAMSDAGVFPEVLVASVMASERTSTLVTALDDYLVHDELLDRMKRQAISAAIYPGVVLTLGVGISIFLLLYVVPRFSQMYEDIQGTASWPTQVLLFISHGVQHGWWVIALAFAALAVGIPWAWREGLIAQYALALANRVPALERHIRQFRLAKFFQSLALMFKGGYTLDEAMAMCEKLSLGADLTDQIRRARTAITQGKPIAQSLAQAGLTEVVTERLLAVGERTGGFDAVLQTIANRHAEQFATFMERATRVVEPIMLLLVALMVGGIVVLMYMPIFDIASSIG
jgi:general secretion pathway protein F